MGVILVDTGPLVALFDPSEQVHAIVVNALAMLRPSEQLVTTLAVVTEVTQLLDFSVRKQTEFLQWVELGGLTVKATEAPDFPAMRQLMQRYANLPMDFADATLVMLADRLATHQILTLNRRNFSIYRTVAGRALYSILPA